MDKQSRKELINEYKNRKAEMGIISYHCIPTDEYFLDISKDTKADLNSHRFKLNANWHGNQELQSLWKEHGEAGFEVSVIEELEYEDLTKDYTKELEEMLNKQLATKQHAKRIGKDK